MGVHSMIHKDPMGYTRALKDSGAGRLYTFDTEAPMFIPPQEDSNASSKPTNSVSNMLPVDSQERKEYPVFEGVLKYFPRAIGAVAHQSFKGNEKHHPNTPLHWDNPKSNDHSDCLVRHLIDSLDPNCNQTEELTAVAWRALALLETHLENKND